MIHNGECRIDLDAGLQMKPLKVVQGAVDLSLEFCQSAGAAPAPAQIIIKGSPENQARVLNLLGLAGLPDVDLASMLREKHPELSEGKDDAECAKGVREMVLESLLEMRGE